MKLSMPHAKPLWLAMALTAFVTVSITPLTAAETSPRRFIIDSHQHYRAESDYIERVVKIYRPLNAMACVLTPISGLEVVRKAAADHPDVIIPYGRISVDDPRAASEIEQFAAAGFKGVKMHSPRFNWDDERYFPFYAQLMKHQMVALFHTGISSRQPGPAPQYTSMERMRPGYLDTLARAFPHLTIQGAHLGNPWYDEAAEAARWSPHLYTVYAFEKIVFGSDEPPENLSRVISQYEEMLEACGVPEASRRKIFGETMARILRINVADRSGGAGRR